MAASFRLRLPLEENGGPRGREEKGGERSVCDEAIYSPRKEGFGGEDERRNADSARVQGKREGSRRYKESIVA